MTSPPSDARPYDRGRGGGEPEDPHALLDRARRLSAAGGHPAAGGAWERAATALRRAGGAITPADHADALDATALDCRGGARPAAETLFSHAAELHERSGQLGKALISRARALVTGPEPGATVCAGLAELGERAVGLHAAGRATVAQTATVLLLRCRARADLLDTTPDPAAEAAALGGDLARLVAFALPHRADPAVLGPLSDSRALLGRVTAPDDPPSALAHLWAAVADHGASGRPWPPTEAELLLAGVLRATGARTEAATVLRTAVGSGEENALLRAADRARLRLALAWTLEGPETSDGLDPRGGDGGGGWDGGDGQDRGHGRPRRPGGEEVVSLLTEAVRLSDRSGEDPRLGVLARLRLGSAHAARGRWQEAAAVLEQVLAGPARDGDEAARVRARAWIAFCALRLGEPERAARQYALAAAEARLRADSRCGAALSHRAAHALGTAGAPEKSARAYERAADLWRSVGDHGAAARSLRARARQVRTAWGAARAEVILEEALREAQRGLRGVPAPAERERLRAELVRIREELTDLVAPGADDDTGPGLWLPPDPYEVSGRYQVNVYGDVGGAGPPAATAPGTRVQGCV
ncbi:hypothetical protein [Streptomyces sp. WAC01280]|uniref:hypothetical protein n=1 Tax=Streptomyces sp. WAC01280 TaxID=2487424 RepID=UPI000F79266E|nr:hypothetical protein [Streptomyces sp. WAC01280]RSS56658.1 hypothetical protein EF909_11195 [Streptomyces sp. WAC01280]